MAVSKLTVYNEALRRLGEVRLASLTEDREARYELDDLWDLGAVDQCLRVASPLFARKTVKLTTTTTTANHALENEHTQPSGFVALVGLFSDADLDEETKRYLIEQDKIYSELDTLWIRYVHDYSADFTYWTQDFVNVVGAYLARGIGSRINPGDAAVYDEAFKEAVSVSMALTAAEEPRSRPEKSISDVNVDWLPIYNDVLQILGRPKMTTFKDERFERILIDTARETGLVTDLLSSYSWIFMRKLVKLEYNSHLEPVWGFSRVHETPTDCEVIDGIFRDEYTRTPLKDYRYEESRYLYCDVDELWLNYIPNTLYEQPASWPVFFKRHVAGAIAEQIKLDDRFDFTIDKLNRVQMQATERRTEAENRDFKQSPPVVIRTGNWARSRMGYNRGDHR
jgi:hypothetical protein